MGAPVKVGDTFTLSTGMFAKECRILALEERRGRPVAIVLTVPRSGLGGGRKTVVYQRQVLADLLASERAMYGRRKR